jgi:DNA helicase HerA-like ATPase
MQYDDTPLRPRDADQPADGLGAPPEPGYVALRREIAETGGPWQPEHPDAVGHTMFDAPGSQDNSVTVLLPKERIPATPSQALVRIRSKDEHGERSYLGAVVAGPFAEPDGLRADSPVLVTVVTRGGIFVPNYHGRVQVEILGEEQDGALVPPRFRPLPNSPVWVLDAAETEQVLQAEGDLELGVVVGQEEVGVGIPSWRKDVLPRHTAILGTTGGGKSTTVARLVQQAQASGCAVILLDVEGEYTFLHEPTTDAHMRTALARRGLFPAGVPGVSLYHLAGRDTANPDHPARTPFALQFARLSPHAVIEVLDLNEAQSERFLKAYDIAKIMLRELGIFPAPGHPDQERLALEVDEFERGYPRLTLTWLMDVVGACSAAADKQPDAFEPRVPALQTGEARASLRRHVQAAQPTFPSSWRVLLGRLARLARLRVFDDVGSPMRYLPLLRPGQVSVIDLSDTDSPALSNLVIADVLRGVQETQEKLYGAYERAAREGRTAPPPARVLIVIEEAHEFLSAERADKMPILFQQVARIAKRGRKRWLGLVFVTQLPQHLPRQLFGLVNSYVLHKIADPQVVSTLRHTVSGIDEGLWRRLPGLAPGQAIVAFPHLARPLLVAVDPAPAQLRLVD